MRFLEQSHTMLLLRNPQALTEGGVANLYGQRNDRLNDLSDAYLRETQTLEAAILELLRGYDVNELTDEQQVWYRTYEWYLDNQVRGHGFLHHSYPVHHFVGSYHDELIRLFTEIHPMQTREDVEDYLARLELIDDQIAQLLEGLAIREELGILPPRLILDMAAGRIRGYLGMRSPDPESVNAQHLSIFSVFSSKLDGISELSAEERQDFRSSAVERIEQSFVPAYVQFLTTIDRLASVADDDAGVWKLPDGEAFYAYMLRTETSTDLTPLEIHQLGLAEVERIHGEMRDIFAQLEYPEGESLGQSLDRAIRDGGSFPLASQADREAVLAEYERLIDDIEGRLDPAFDFRPSTDVVVMGDRGYSGGGYYVPGSVDGSRPGAFHTGVDGGSVPHFGMPTLAYHEAVPGHHFQITIEQELVLPSFTKSVFFNAYVEGWGLYAERLAWELSAYESDPYGDLGRLHLELLRAVRLVTDTGIHSLQWTREEARAYMRDAMGDSRGRWIHEVDRYTVLPGQATGYKIGMLRILELRERAQDQLGDEFDLAQFHRVVLENGSLPLEVLDIVVERYIERVQN
jgi:uncharacterized protein (DUF885 family)